MSPPSPPQDTRGRSPPHLYEEGTHPHEQLQQVQEHQENHVQPRHHPQQQHHHHFIDVNDYDWMGVLDHSVFGDDVIGASVNGNENKYDDDEGRKGDAAAVHPDADAVASAAAVAAAASSSASSYPANCRRGREGRRLLDCFGGVEYAAASHSSGAATMPDGVNDDDDDDDKDDARKTRVERKRSRERKRRLDTNSQLAALSDLVRDIDATDLAEEEAMALAYSYTRKARRWNEHGTGDVGGGDDDDDFEMMVMMSVMDKSPYVWRGGVSGGMMKMGGRMRAVVAPPSSNADAIAGECNGQPPNEEKAPKKMKSLDNNTIDDGTNDSKGIPPPSSVANLQSSSAAASNNRIDLIARTIVQLKKLRQLRRVRNEELRTIRNRHCELRKDCEGLRKVVAHYKAVGMGGTGIGGMGIEGGYGRGYQPQQQMMMTHMQPSEKVMMMVPMMVSPQDAVMQMSASRYHPASASAGHQYHHAVPPAAVATPTVGNFHHQSLSMAAAPSTSMSSSNNNNSSPAGYPPCPPPLANPGLQQQSAVNSNSYYLSTNALPPSFQQQKHQRQQQPSSVAMLPSQNAAYQLPASETPNEGDGNISNEILPQGASRVEDQQQVQTQAPPLNSTTGMALPEPTQTGGGGVAGYHPPPALPPHQPLHGSVISGPAPVIMSINPQLNNNCIPMPNNVTVFELNHPISHYANTVGAAAVLQHAPYPHHGASNVAYADHYDPHHPNASTTYYQTQSAHAPPLMGTTMMHNPHQQQRPLATGPNVNNPSHANFCHNNLDTAFLQHQMPQHQQLQHTSSGGGNNQPMMIPPEKRPTATSTTTAASQGGGGNLAHCA